MEEYRGKVLTTRIIQAKTGQPVTLTLHVIAQSLIEKQKAKLEAVNIKNAEAFSLPTADGANKIVDAWVQSVKIEKYITWSCARLNFSILLQDKNVDDATAAYLMGHTTTDQVRKTYKRHRPKDQTQTIGKLPIPEQNPYFLNLTN